MSNQIENLYIPDNVMRMIQNNDTSELNKFVTKNQKRSDIRNSIVIKPIQIPNNVMEMVQNGLITIREGFVLACIIKDVAENGDCCMTNERISIMIDKNYSTARKHIRNLRKVKAIQVIRTPKTRYGSCRSITTSIKSTKDGIFMPAKICKLITNGVLTVEEAVILAHIHNKSRGKNMCTDTNTDFAKLICKCVRSIRRHISQLKTLKLITIEHNYSQWPTLRYCKYVA